VSVARLEDGSDVLHLTEANGFFVQSLDTGYPTARAVVDNRAGADGTYDSTAYFGNRTVSMFCVRLVIGVWRLSS
jgi:hypothetical protein